MWGKRQGALVKGKIVVGIWKRDLQGRGWQFLATRDFDLAVHRHRACHGNCSQSFLNPAVGKHLVHTGSFISRE